MRKFKKFIGWLMVATPFIVLFVFITIKYDVWFTLLVYGGCAFVVSFIWVGATFIVDNE